MIRARPILARLATIAAMAFCVSGLVRLFENGKPAAFASQYSDPVINMADAWKGELNFAPSYAALNPYANAGSQAGATLFDPSDDYWGLPRKHGYDTVAAYCGACHSLQIVMAQRQPREGWDYLLNWMVEKQGMAPPAAETRAEMLNYLSSEFGQH